MHSSSHRKALVKALTKMNIQTTATYEAMVAKITKNKQGVKGKRTSYVMVDDGFAINFYSL